MSNAPVHERLRRAAADLHGSLDRVPIPDPPVRRRTRLAPVMAAALAGVAAVVVLLATAPFGGPSPAAAPSVHSPDATGLPLDGPVFGEETGIVLLVDDGIDGLTAIDLDRRLAARSVVEGQRAGDEEHSMVRVGDHLVVGWAEPHSVNIRTRESISLGEATVFVPAAEPNRVWMVDPEISMSSQPSWVWQVDVTTGEALGDPGVISGRPQLGVPGGLVVPTDFGLRLESPTTGDMASLGRDSAGFAHDVHGAELVWCVDDCALLIVTDTSDLRVQEYSPPEGYAYFVDADVSPDGRWLAALLQNRAGQTGAVWLLDRHTDDLRLLADSNGHVDYLAWSPHSAQLFATSYGYGQRETQVWRYDIADDDFRTVVLPFGGTLTPVAVENSLAGGFIGEEIESEGCPAPTAQPSGRTGICTFDY